MTPSGSATNLAPTNSAAALQAPTPATPSDMETLAGEGFNNFQVAPDGTVAELIWRDGGPNIFPNNGPYTKPQLIYRTLTPIGAWHEELVAISSFTTQAFFNETYTPYRRDEQAQLVFRSDSSPEVFSPVTWPSAFTLGKGVGTMPRYEEIHGRVARLLVETLNVDEDQVKPAATLRRDLGAESIDFLDIVFRLEREFDIRIPDGELFPESIFQNDPELVQDGCVTEKGLLELRSRMPYLDVDSFNHDRSLGAVSELFTVGLLTRYVDWKLGQCAGAGPSDC